MDGLKLYLQQCVKSNVQKWFYNGWTHDHYVTSVFIFCPNDTIPIAFFKVPGSVHDSQIAHWGHIYDKFDGVYKVTWGKCTMDSTFGRVNQPFLIKSLQDILVSFEATSDEQRLEIQCKLQVSSMRQAMEWGMRSIQSLFPRLKIERPLCL
jgi:hypothetical protein